MSKNNICLGFSLLFLFVFMAGCSSPKSLPNSSDGKKKNNVVLEVPDESTGMKSVIKVSDEYGHLVRIEVVFANEVKGIKHFDSKGSIKMLELLDPDGSSIEYNLNKENKVLTAKYFRADKSLASEKITSADGQETNQSFFEEDGETLKAKLYFNGAKTIDFVLYQQGKLEYEEHTAQPHDENEKTVSTVYGDNEKVVYRQYWGYGGLKNARLPGFVGELLYVEEYEADGKKVKRKLTFKSDPVLIDAPPDQYLNSMKVVLAEYPGRKYYFRDNGTLEKLEEFDASGKVAITIDYPESMDTVEPFERRFVRQYSSKNLRPLLRELFKEDDKNNVALNNYLEKLIAVN